MCCGVSGVSGVFLVFLVLAIADKSGENRCVKHQKHHFPCGLGQGPACALCVRTPLAHVAHVHLVSLVHLLLRDLLAQAHQDAPQLVAREPARFHVEDDREGINELLLLVVLRRLRSAMTTNVKGDREGRSASVLASMNSSCTPGWPAIAFRSLPRGPPR